MPASSSALSAHEAEAQDADAHDAEAHEAEAQDADAHEAEAQDADAHDAEAQEADAHDAEDHEASLWATFAQLAASNTCPDPSPAGRTNSLRPAFGFGGSTTAAAAATSTMPTPSAPRVALGVSLAETMRAPFTWSGVQSGCRART